MSSLFSSPTLSRLLTADFLLCLCWAGKSGGKGVGPQLSRQFWVWWKPFSLSLSLSLPSSLSFFLSLSVSLCLSLSLCLCLCVCPSLSLFLFPSLSISLSLVIVPLFHFTNFSFNYNPFPMAWPSLARNKCEEGSLPEEASSSFAWLLLFRNQLLEGEVWPIKVKYGSQVTVNTKSGRYNVNVTHTAAHTNPIPTRTSTPFYFQVISPLASSKPYFCTSYSKPSSHKTTFLTSLCKTLVISILIAFLLNGLA